MDVVYPYHSQIRDMYSVNRGEISSKEDIVECWDCIAPYSIAERVNNTFSYTFDPPICKPSDCRRRLSISYGACACSSHHRAGAEDQTTNQPPTEFPPLGITERFVVWNMLRRGIDIHVMGNRHVSYLNLWRYAALVWIQLSIQWVCFTIRWHSRKNVECQWNTRYRDAENLVDEHLKQCAYRGTI